MSLRRKSCNACFQGRRKCDLAFPTCQRCRKTGKRCQYVTEPAPVVVEYSRSTPSSADIVLDSSDGTFTGGDVLGSHKSRQDAIQETSFDWDLQNSDFNFEFTIQTPPLVEPNLLGELGHLSPSHSNTESWQWVIRQLQECPEKFAKAGENMFIHPSTYRLQPPPAIRAAYGICAASQVVTPATSAMFIGFLESEASTLLNDVEVESVPEGLARLQAILLYQILRLLSCDSTQRDLAEQQKNVINAWALRLLQQIQTDSLSSRTYEDLVLAESVRRTVMTTYLVHALSSIFKHGVCTELPTLALLPISVDSKVWEPSNGFCAFSADGDLGTMKYGKWTDMWVGFSPRRKLDPFQKMMMMACKGKAKVEELEIGMM